MSTAAHGEPAVGEYAGAGLGRPASGAGSLAGLGRRWGSLFVDWALCLLMARGFVGPAVFGAGSARIWPLAVLFVMNLLLVPTAGATIGQRLLGLQTERVDGGRLAPGAAAVRALLLVVWLPTIGALWQRDRRGGHDLASGAVVARTR